MESNVYHHSIIDHIPDALFIVNLKGEILDVNQTACTCLGYTREELKNLAFRNIISEDNIPEFNDKVELLIKKKHLLTEVEHVDSNGKIIPAELSLKIIDQNNENVILIISRDITERKQQEQKQRISEVLYRKLFELANENIYIIDRNGFVVLANSHCLNSVGYSNEEFMSTPIIDFVHQDDREYVGKKIKDRLSGDDIGYAYQFRFIDKDGDIKWLYQNSIGIVWNGEPAGLCVSSDITELKNVEAALRESEEKYRLVVENASEGIFIVQDGYIVFENRKMAEIFGYTIEEFKKDNFLTFIHPDDKEIVKENHLNRLKGHQIPSYLLRGRKKDGEYITIEVTATLFEFNSKPATLNFINDVSERIEAERKLRENEERYRSFFSNSIEAISIFDTETLKYIEVNDAFCKMYGYTKEEALTMTVADVSVEPEESEQAIKTSVKKGGVEIPIRYHKKKDGTIMIVRISAGPFKWKGRNVMYSILRDITEQLRTEQELIDSKDLLQKMADSMPAYVGVADAETIKYRFVNQRFVEGFGKTREEIIGSYFAEIIGKENAEFALPYIEKVRKGKPSSYINTFDLSEGKRYINVSFTPSFSADGNVKDIIIMSHDITNIKRAEQELKKAKETAEYANQIKSELIATKNRFFSIIAHDLKSPFNGLIGLTELLINDAVDIEDYKKIAAHMHDMAINGFTLLENLLDWARTQTGEIKYNPEKVNLKKIVEYNIALLKQNAIEKNIILSESIMDDIIIEADDQMINTVLRNLISNAIKFTPKGGHVTIEAILEKENVSLSVSDTGIGINPEDIQKLFKIDDSYSTPGTEKERGTGLGLILCKEFIDKHSGSINVESEVSKGTKIIVKLPKQRNIT